MCERVDDGREQNRAAGADAVAERARRDVPRVAAAARRDGWCSGSVSSLLPFVAACCAA